MIERTLHNRAEGVLSDCEAFAIILGAMVYAHRDGHVNWWNSCLARFEHEPLRGLAQYARQQLENNVRETTMFNCPPTHTLTYQDATRERVRPAVELIHREIDRLLTST
jgi:hypothetical protein